MAVDDEVLEDEPSTGPIQLVGASGLARGSDCAVAVQAAEAEWAELQVAAVDVFERDE